MAPPKIGSIAGRSDADLANAMITDLRGSILYRGEPMALLAGRTLLSLPWPGLGHPDYRWEHCFWVNSSDFSSNAQMGLAVVNDMKLFYTNQVHLLGTRWYTPHTTTVIFQQSYGPSQVGSQGAQANYNILVSARWRMHGNDDSYTYHLHRQPVGETYLEAGGWSATGYSQQQTRMNTYIAQGIYRTGTGSLITTGDVAVEPVQWQLRHGTKRRDRRFWLP